MPKKIAGFIIAAAVLLFLAVLAYTNLEVRPRTVFVPPSREVLVNNFFALETWLARTGRPPRFAKRGGPSQIIGAPEKTVFVQASVFDWEDAAEPLKNWIAAGGFLLVSLEPPPYKDAALDAFLAGFGISPAFFENPSPDTGEEEPPPEPAPDFDPAVRFTVTKETAPSVFTVQERGGVIRLAGIPLGAGAAVFIGAPRFMENGYLEREVNARLAWELTGGRTGDTPGVLFIRGRRQVKSLLGKLAERGNFLPLGVSLLFLVIAGFWMVLPPFGLLLQEKKPSGRPIRERFLAEIRFLKKYRALETYLEVYIREIKRKLRDSPDTMGAFPALRAGNRAFRGSAPLHSLRSAQRTSPSNPLRGNFPRAGGPLYAALPAEIEKTLKTRGRLPYKELIQNLQKLETMMERL